MKCSPKLLALLATAACGLSAAGALGWAAPGKAPPPPGSLQTFWEAFQSAFAAKDAAKVAAMTKFPLFVRGQLDGDPEYHINRARFLRFFPKMAEEEVIEDGPAESLRSFVERTKTLAVDPNDDPNSARLSNLVFRFADGRWKLDMIYSGVKP